MSVGNSSMKEKLWKSYMEMMVRNTFLWSVGNETNMDYVGKIDLNIPEQDFILYPTQ